jgi:hypothetical protein
MASQDDKKIAVAVDDRVASTPSASGGETGSGEVADVNVADNGNVIGMCSSDVHFLPEKHRALTQNWQMMACSVG